MQSPKRIYVIIGATVIALIALIIISISIKNSSNNLELSLPSNSTIPAKTVADIKYLLLQTIRRNTKDFDPNTQYKAAVRNYNEDKLDNETSATFIVDFDSIQQSYAVYTFWPYTDTDQNIIISCPLQESKYPSTPCSTEENSSLDITSYLPFSDTLPSGKRFTIEPDYYGNQQKLYLKIVVDTCVDADAEQALIKAKEWVKSIYLNPDNYRFYATTSCDKEQNE